MQHEICFADMVDGISRQFLMTLFLSLLKKLKFGAWWWLHFKAVTKLLVWLCVTQKKGLHAGLHDVGYNNIFREGGRVVLFHKTTWILRKFWLVKRPTVWVILLVNLLRIATIHSFVKVIDRIFFGFTSLRNKPIWVFDAYDAGLPQKNLVDCLTKGFTGWLVDWNMNQIPVYWAVRFLLSSL